ncbi:unnamed protein product [Phyllotreta striolata]|uniref:Putative inorganic phosphate cotransporter n=1 Tax=Phyllotreta striolata TaxID=444603 RepID=A0A9N9XV41_PHYSR|nr:unnamed protein product [Phyllotreta striolata]
MSSTCNDNVAKTDGDPAPKPAGFGYRHVQYILMLAACTVSYGIRGVLSVAVLAMIADDNNEKSYKTYPEWKSKKNLMLSSFFWGYIVLQVGAGQLAKNYGPKLFLGSAIFITSISTILVPILGDAIGYGGIIFCRVLQGLSQGFLVPSVHNLLGQWAPLSERATFGSAVYAGQALGNMLSMPITGVMCSSKFGWPAAFYLYGAFGMVWCILWFLFGSNRPDEHRSISPEERRYIEASLPNEEGGNSKVPTPWKSIATSLPMISLVIAHMGQNWGFWTLLMEIPSFMTNIFGDNLPLNSLLSSIPYFMMFALTLLISPIADYIIDKKFVSLIVSRKIFNTIGLGLPGLTLIALCFVENKIATVVLLVIAVGLNSAQYSGFNINHIDLSPVHAGTMMAITNSMATIASIIAPLYMDLVENLGDYDEKDKSLWNIVFCTSAGVYIFAAAFFIIFASGDLQPWNSGVKPESAKLKVMRKLSVISVS